MVLGAAQAVLAKDSSAPPASALTFVEVANPAAPRTGLLNFLPRSILLKVLHCTTGLCSQPSDSQYNTVMVINQYDGFADFPTKPWNVLAELNALVGLYYRHGQTGGADLTTVPAQNISTTANSRGATTTVYLVPAPFLPLTRPLLALGVPQAAVDKLDTVLRPIIEAGYSRNDPKAPTPQREVASRVLAATAIRSTATIASAPLSTRLNPHGHLGERQRSGRLAA